MRKAIYSFSFLFLLIVSACKTSCCDGACPQSIVTATAASSECERLTLHCVQQDGSIKACASTDAARVGKASDPEDVRAMNSGETVVLEQGGAIDVTVPILEANGVWTTVCGVTLLAEGMSREQAVEKATAIAMTVKASLGGDCASGCCDDDSCCK